MKPKIELFLRRLPSLLTVAVSAIIILIFVAGPICWFLYKVIISIPSGYVMLADYTSDMDRSITLLGALLSLVVLFICAMLGILRLSDWVNRNDTRIAELEKISADNNDN